MTKEELETDARIRWPRVFGVIFAILIVAELAARLVVWRATGVAFKSLELYRWSPYGLVRNNPELSSREFAINNAGFRSTHDSKQKKNPHTLRTIVLGGSVAYSGIGRVVSPKRSKVRSDQTVAQYLEETQRSDSSRDGLDVEVLNAAVNFNRINEVSAGYLHDWRFWDPDLVVVMGSANNFGYAPPAGSIEKRAFIIQSTHSWALEFDRDANGTSLPAFGERIFRSIAQESATAALAKKGFSGMIDGAAAWSSVHALAQPRLSSAPAPTYASFEEYDLYIDEYLGYADAIIAAADISHQKVAFFWEYYIAHLGGIRPFNEEEQYLFDANKAFAVPLDREYDFHARDRVRQHVESKGAIFIDPLNVLRADPSTIYIDYLHYTPEGNRAMAGAINAATRDWFAARAKEVRSVDGAKGRPSTP